MRARTESTRDTFKSLRIRAGDSRFCEPPASTDGRDKKTWTIAGLDNVPAILN
jgi:hypothetical protein